VHLRDTLRKVKPWQWALGGGIAAAAVAIGVASARSGGACTFEDVDDGTTLTRTFTYSGNRTTPDDSGQDVCLFPPLPANELFYLQSAELAVNAPNPVSWDQQDFIYTKVLQYLPEAWTPNVEGLVNVHAPAVGSYLGGGGPGPDPGGFDRWTSYSLPIPMSSSILPQPGSGLGYGNSVVGTLVYAHGGSIQGELRWTGSKFINGPLVLDSPPIPDGSRALIEFTFAQANQDYTASLTRVSDGSSLFNRTSTGSQKGNGIYQVTGGYSKSSGRPNAQNVAYNSYQFLEAQDSFALNVVPAQPMQVGWLVQMVLLPA
jgi:hypothetical protein